MLQEPEASLFPHSHDDNDTISCLCRALRGWLGKGHETLWDSQTKGLLWKLKTAYFQKECQASNHPAGAATFILTCTHRLCCGVGDALDCWEGGTKPCHPHHVLCSRINSKDSIPHHFQLHLPPQSGTLPSLPLLLCECSKPPLKRKAINNNYPQRS